MNTIMEKLITEGVVSSDIASQIQESFELKVQTEVEKRLEEKVQELNEQQEVKLQELESLAEEWSEKASEEMLESVNDYLDLVVSSWISENQSKLDSMVEGKRVEAMSEGLKALMITSGVTMTEIEESIAEEKAEEMQESENIKNELNALAEEVISLKKERDSLKKESLLKGITESLTIPQAEKITKLAENISFDYNNTDAYVSQLTDIKESLFTTSEALTESKDDLYGSFKGVSKENKIDNSLIGSASHLF